MYEANRINKYVQCQAAHFTDAYRFVTVSKFVQLKGLRYG